MTEGLSGVFSQPLTTAAPMFRFDASIFHWAEIGPSDQWGGKLKQGCLLPSHGRKVRDDEIGRQHGLSVRGSVALTGDGQHQCSKKLKV